jgi:hypothetical protein
MVTEFSIDADKSFIFAGFLEDLSICDRLIDFFENSDTKYPGEIVKNGQGAILKNIKDSIDLTLRPDQSITQEYAIELQKVVEVYKEKYAHCNNTAPWGIEAVNIQKYNPAGAYFEWHTERVSGIAPDGIRHLVFMTYLNDVNDQGETEFFYQQVKIKPQKGLTLIWPVDWTHTHRGLPSPSETKYIATGWFCFMPV